MRETRKGTSSHYPPAYPSPVTNSRQRAAVREQRALASSPLTRTRFSLYTWYGRIYLILCLVTFTALPIYIFIRFGSEMWRPLTIEHVVTGVAGLIGIAAIQAFLVLMYFRQRRIYRLSHDLCPKCGYDLRATPEGCPECGTNSAEAARENVR